MGWQDAPIVDKQSAPGGWQSAPIVKETQPEESMMDKAYDSVVGGVKALATDPGGQATVVDSVGFGSGNEIIEGAKALYKSATDSQGPEKTFFKYYDPAIAKVEESKDKFAKEHPVAALVGSVAPAMATGGLGMKLVNPTTWPKALGLTGVEGLVYGAGEAKPGEKIVEAGQGAISGVAFGAGGTLLEKLLGTVTPKAGKGLVDLFRKGDPKISDKEAMAQAKRYVANYLKQTGDTPEVIASKLKTMYPNEATTLADVMEQGAPLAKNAARHSDDSRRAAIGSPLNRSPEALGEQLRAGLGAGTKDIKRNNILEADLKLNRQSIGEEIDEYAKEMHGIPLTNQEDLEKFFDLGVFKGMKKKALARLEFEGLGPKHPSTPGRMDEKTVGGPIDDPNTPIIDIPLIRAFKAELDDAYSKAKDESRDTALWAKAKRQLDSLAEAGAPDEASTSIFSRYRVAGEKQRAYQDGLKDFSTAKESDILKKVTGMKRHELDSYKEGVVTHLADKKEDLLSFLNYGEMRKILPVFGSGRTSRVEDTLATALTKKKVSEAVAEGIADQVESVGARTMRGMLLAAKDVLGRLRGKRAYSRQGGVFMVGNEVVDVMMNSDLHPKTVTNIMHLLATSGDDVPKLLENISRVEMPGLVKKEMLDRAASAAAKARMGAYGAGGASLVGEITGRN